ncbi:MAG: ROK family protein, partial [Verrucomicrobiota bacterium]
MMLPTVVEQAVLRLIQSKVATSQIELARALKLRPNTVHGIVKRLMADGFISTEKTVRGSRGRPSLHFTITLPGKVLVIQLLGTEWRGAIFGSNREEETGVVTMHSPIFSDLTESRSFFLQIRDRALAGANCRLEELQGIMVSTNAVKRPESGLLSSSVTPWISELSEDYLTTLLGAPTLVSTQGKLAELELRTWTRDGIRSLVRFNVGDGASSHYASLFGPASMAESFPGEIGHVQRKTGGEICGCGNRGCLETLIAGPRMLRRVRLDLESGLQTVLRKSVDKSPAEFFQDLYLADQEGQDAYVRTLVTEFLEH